MTGPLVPVGMLNLIRRVLGIHHHRFNLSVKRSSPRFTRAAIMLSPKPCAVVVSAHASAKDLNVAPFLAMASSVLSRSRVDLTSPSGRH